MYYQRKTIQINNVVQCDDFERYQFEYFPYRIPN